MCMYEYVFTMYIHMLTSRHLKGKDWKAHIIGRSLGSSIAGVALHNFAHYSSVWHVGIVEGPVGIRCNCRSNVQPHLLEHHW